ncbi:tRNA lysidine(34) synthetase [Fibrobacter sp.]|uniref:tRNA lysidine(34) synthetase n=1 Tax=Fibrobacter sp. TaxID=35828 RepID=UPI0025C0414D|nr:tRNA lysidine(34) synthetase [Fibrobacter sp.]
MTFDLVEHIRRHGFKRLLLAVSGGLDSICLAHYFIEKREALGIEWLGIAHVHHGLREGTADRDAKFVEEFAKSHGVPFFLKRLDGEALKNAEGSLEENARDARYKALVEIALDPSTPLHSAQDDTLQNDESRSRNSVRDDNKKDDSYLVSSFDKLRTGYSSLVTHTPYPMVRQKVGEPVEPHQPILRLATDPIHQTPIAIVTAHHANDQAETMLMRIKRGTTLAGLRGIQEVRVLSNSRGVAGLASEAPLEGVMKDRATGCNQGESSPTQDDKNSRDPSTTNQRFSAQDDTLQNDESRSRNSVRDDNKKDDSSLVSSFDKLRTGYSSFVYLYRPFLHVTRAELLAYARENSLSWCEDESNADVKFTRNKIRHELLPNLERECPGATKQLSRIAELADRAYAKVMEKCSRSFDFAQDDTTSFPFNTAQDDKKTDPGTMSGMTSFISHTPSLVSRHWTQASLLSQPFGSAMPNFVGRVARPIWLSSLVSLDKKKLNKILREHAKADLSELFRLWLSELGFRFPIGFFYAPKEPAHIKIPIRASYRKRSIVKIRHTVWICEFKDTESALKFVSCEMKEKDYNE